GSNPVGPTMKNSLKHPFNIGCFFVFDRQGSNLWAMTRLN
ncbi:MAG: hypothetical protein ACI9A1_000267, partial [Lentimonas sp.]